MKLNKTDEQIEAMPLVESMRQFAIEQGFNLTRQEAYRNAVENKLVDINGNPTKYALDNGLVEQETLTKFNELDYPFFVDNSYDAYVDEQTANDAKIMSKRNMYELMYQAGLIFPNGKPTPKAIKEKIASWGDTMPSMKLQAKMTVKEFVKSMKCLHKYSTKHFTKMNDEKGFGFDVSVTYDLAKRVANGELNGDKEKSIDVMNQLEEQYGNDIEPL